jgi:hypothetical protein
VQVCIATVPSFVKGQDILTRQDKVFQLGT